jgi:hypothetical protein
VRRRQRMPPSAAPHSATADMCGRIPDAKRHNRPHTPDGTGCNIGNASSLQFPSLLSKELVKVPTY